MSNEYDLFVLHFRRVFLENKCWDTSKTIGLSQKRCSMESMCISRTGGRELKTRTKATNSKQFVGLQISVTVTSVSRILLYLDKFDTDNR